MSHPPQPPYGPPPSQPYGAPPPGYPVQQPPPKKKAGKVVLMVVGAALTLCCGGVAIAAVKGGDDSDPAAVDDAADATKAGGAQPAKKKSAAKAKALPAARIGTAVRDGKFEFTVTDLDCSKTTLGPDFLRSKAQGKYCVVSVSVRNIGDKAQLFSGSNQKAYDLSGAEFENDGAAEFNANDNNQTFLNDINPGNRVSGKVVFDVPQSTVLTTIELHDSFWSDGVKVTLK